MTLLYSLSFAAVMAMVAPFWVWRQYRQLRTWRALKEAAETGRDLPLSIRPYVDPHRCIGCGICTRACPEGQVLQLLAGRARVVDNSLCIGHGLCAVACPVGAIELLFGSEKRGVDLPRVGGDFQTEVPGLYVAGELGGMGLIANAVDQGRQAMDYIAQQTKPGTDDYDVIVVGAGPAGMSAAIEAQQVGLRALILEQDELGGAVTHYPRKKLVMSRAFGFPGQPVIPAGQLTKEQLIALFQETARATGIEVAEQERVEAVEPEGHGFRVTTARRTLTAQRVLLCLGRRGSPRQLEVPGEEQSHVHYRLLEPDKQSGHMLVVGAGDSAVEAACSLDDEGCDVVLVVRGKAVVRPRPKNRKRLEASGVTVVTSSTVLRIGVGWAELLCEGEARHVRADAVYVLIGGTLPTKLLVDAGVAIDRHFGHRTEALA